MLCPAGIDPAVRPPPSLVSTALCATPGTVSSTPALAAAAASEPTPGTISKVRSCSAHQAICSVSAEYSETSPECSRTSAASGFASYTASTSSNVIPAESCASTPSPQCSSTAAGTREDAHTTTSAVASRRAPRRVIRSGAPGPAPTNEISPVAARIRPSHLPGTPSPVNAAPYRVAHPPNRQSLLVQQSIVLRPVGGHRQARDPG